MVLVLALIALLCALSTANADQSAPSKPAGHTALPRLGNWMWPGKDQEMLKKLLALGVGFTSSYDNDPSVGQSLFDSGIVTNLCPGRPSGAELIAGLNLAPEDMDQDSQGHRTGEGIESSVFLDSVLDRYCDYLTKKVRPVVNAPWVAGVTISSPISMYGEVHYAPSTTGQYAVFSRPAKANFRKWLKAQYNDDLSAISKAWGEQIKSWDDITPPEGPRGDSSGIDTRQSWSDFIHWYNWWLDEFTLRGLETVRKETDKPIAAMIGGPKVGYNQGISLGNVGPVVRMLGKLRPAFFNDTDAQTLFSTRYTRAACSQYGVEQMQEHVGPPYLTVFHQYNMVLNVLSCGADHVHLAHLGELFDPNHWFSRTWKNLAPVVLRYQTGYHKSDAAMFHSYMTSWYRPDRSNADTVRLYDTTNTLWTPDQGFPSWGRALASPDVVDDAMIEDGGLKGRKLLVIANSSVTVTSRKAVEAIRKWVHAGGTLIGFGEGCLACTVEPDRSLKSTPGIAGLLPAAEIATAKQKELDKIEHKVGKGCVVLFLKPADCAIRDASGKRFVDDVMAVLRDYADHCGVRRWCEADKDYKVNLLYCGKDLKSGRHLFTADLMQYVRNNLRDAIFYNNCSFDFTFDPLLKGEAELVAITDSFESCQGGTADYNPEAHTLIIRFKLPGKLTLKFGNSRSGLALARDPKLLWDNGNLVLQPLGGYGVNQTQEPISITSDGDLAPKDASIPCLIHGKLHKDKFGGGPTFRLSFSKPSSVTVHVNSVSAPAVLVMKLDGQEALRKDLPNKDNKQDPSAREYDQDFTISVPAGQHDVQITNEGEDWISVDRYIFGETKEENGKSAQMTQATGITINLKNEKQVMHSFGASDCWTCQFIGKNWPIEKRNAIADLLFSKETDANGNPKGIGLSMWRFNIGAGSAEQGEASKIGSTWHRAECFQRPDGTYDWTKQAGEQWFAEAAKKHGVDYLLAFTNSPPVQFTANGIAHATGGRNYNIRKDAMPKFADFLVDVAEHFKEIGLPFDYISPINEPQHVWDTDKQEATPATNEEIAELTRLLGQKLHDKGLAAQAAIAEAGMIYSLAAPRGTSQCADQIKQFWDKSSSLCLVGVPNVARVVSGHSYFTTWPISRQIEERQRLARKFAEIDPKLAFWQTEYCILEQNDETVGGGGRDLGMNTALFVARLIHSDITIADAAQWTWWLGVTPSDFKDGLVYLLANDDKDPGKWTALQHDGSVVSSKLLWAMGNFSRFVRPGMVRIDVGYDDQRTLEDAAKTVMASAYLDKKTNEIVVVLINCTKDPQPIKITDLADLKVENDTFTTYTTSETSDLTKGSTKADNITLPARSVVTLVGKMA